MGQCRRLHGRNDGRQAQLGMSRVKCAMTTEHSRKSHRGSIGCHARARAATVSPCNLVTLLPCNRCAAGFRLWRVAPGQRPSPVGNPIGVRPPLNVWIVAPRKAIIYSLAVWIAVAQVSIGNTLCFLASSECGDIAVNQQFVVIAICHPS
jgi:hypothetical protein